MATRPVFEVTVDEKLFARREVQFKWFGGFALTQSRNNIRGLHGNYLAVYPVEPLPASRGGSLLASERIKAK